MLQGHANLGIADRLALGVNESQFDPMRRLFGPVRGGLGWNVTTFDHPQQTPFDGEFEVLAVTFRVDRERRAMVRGRPRAVFDLHGFDVEIVQSEPSIAKRREAKHFAVVDRIQRHPALIPRDWRPAVRCPLDPARDYHVAFKAHDAEIGNSVGHPFEAKVSRSVPTRGSDPDERPALGRDVA